MRLRFSVAAFALAFAALAPATPASAQQAAAAQPEEQIIVTGRRQTEEQLRGFVSQMSIPSGTTNQLARWDRTICPGVAGIRTRYAQFLIDRMAQHAVDVGLDVGEPGCRANVLIVISADPDATARELFEHNRDLMGYYPQAGRNTLGRRALTAFVESNAPVRWWHVSRTVTREGDAISDDRNPDTYTEVNLGGGASRLHRTTHQDFGVAFVIVDANRLTGVSFEALADYLAMVTLAQLDPNADTVGFPTILNLFSAGQSAPRAMTDWDVAYLRGLYAVSSDAPSANRQAGEIAHNMDQQLTPH